MTESNKKFETRSVHAGQEEPDEATNARAPPIYQTTSYVFDDTAVATSSGMAAFDLLNFVLASAGDNVVSASALYGGTYAYLEHTAPRRGVETRFVDTLDYEAYDEAIDDDTAYVHLETIGNPALVTPDIER
ncbi:MAG: PLP-dependent transferase, partial [Halobacteria archaeon]|nr:PLP-dependent transferase [Halobacteria archaeon]